MDNSGLYVKIKDWLILFRIQTAALTAIVPVYPAVAIGYFDASLKLFFIGILVHISGFVMNEYFDLEHDKKAAYLKNKPLVKGSISKRQAIGTFSFTIILSFLFSYIFFKNFFALAILFVAFSFGTLYNIFGKKIILGDFFLAFWVFAFLIFGALCVTSEINIIVYFLCIFAFLQLLFNNSVEGGIKDLETDRNSICIKLGARVKDGKAYFPMALKIYAFSIKSIHISLAIIFLFFVPPTYISFFIFIGLVSIIHLTLFIFLNIKNFDRNYLKKIFGLHETTTYWLAPVLLLPIIGIIPTIILIILPPIWYISFNAILYSSPLEPQV
ncbi:MAG: UbiA family prenyltransferase [Candidatus Thermoplasmatota archaeon]